jgi:hypothetical protein
LARAAIDGYAEAVPRSDMTAPDPAAAKEHFEQFLAGYPTARASPSATLTGPRRSTA